MRLTCSLCKEILAEDGPVTTSYGNEEVYCFCSKECTDKWAFCDHHKHNDHIQPQNPEAREIK